MKKTIKDLVTQLKTDKSGKVNGGFLSIKGGFSLLYVSNNQVCSNSLCNGGSTNSDCTNRICEDTTNKQFKSFGVSLINGVESNERTFMPINKEDIKVLTDFSDLLTLKRSQLKMPRDSVNKLIGWVKVTKS